MKKFIRIGVDLAKNYFQIHALVSEGGPAVTRKLRRSKMHEFFSQIEPCLIGMEACGSAHYWARELKAMGHEVLLMPPAYTKPYVKRGKNDAVDADAICEAMSRPGMRFVPIKSAEQQATLMLHKTRELLVKQRTMSVNALRGHLSEFGIVAAKGIGRVDELLDLAESDATLPAAAKAGVKVLAQALEGLDKAIDDLENEITSAHAQNEMSRLLDKVPGIGKLIASVIAASVPDPSVFKSGRDFAAWLGLTPRQNSSGGKQTLGGITKQGNRYIRKTARLGGDLAAQRRGQAQRRLARLDCRAAGEEAGAAGYGGAGQQAGPDPLGDDEDRRMLPHRDVREGVRKPLVAARRVHKGDLQVRVWQAQRDVMNDTVATEDQEQPAKCHERKARDPDRDPGRRTSSRPADICSAPTGRTYDRSRPNRSKRQKSACQGGPSTYDVQIVAEPDEVDHFLDATLAIRFGYSFRCKAKFDILRDGHVRPEGEVLKHHADAALAWFAQIVSGGRSEFAIDQDVTRIRDCKARD